jgi:hypothetical protein
MKKFAVALLFCGVSAFAATIQYTTTGAFTSNVGDNPNGTTLTFTGITAGTIGVPTYTSLGSFTEADPGGTTGTFNENFVLTLTVTGAPGGTFSTPISGTITGNTSGIAISFTPGSEVIGGYLWTLTNSSFGLNNPSQNSGVTSVQAFVSAPEPASLGLLGASLAGLGIAFRRRRAA